MSRTPGGVASTAEQRLEDAAAIGPEHQHHTHQRASGHYTRRYWQGELLGELRLASLEQERNEGAEEFTLPVASGVVAGGSLMGVVLVFWANGGSIFKTLFGG